jgi:RNA polymerase sigma factor (sigma-70 family)
MSVIDCPALTRYLDQAAKYEGDDPVLSSALLVFKIALRQRPKNTADLWDTIQDGTEGLIRNAHKFDASRGTWGSFASHCILGGIYEAKFKNSSVVRLPREVMTKKIKMSAMRNKGMNVRQIAREMGLKETAVNQCLDGATQEYIDEMREDSTSCPHRAAEAREQVERVADNFKRLTQKQKKAISHKIIGDSLRDISEIMGGTTQNASLHVRNAVEVLR